MGWQIKKDLDSDFLFCIERDSWRVSLCFRSLYITDILWNIIQDTLGSLWLEWLFLKLDTFTNPVHNFFFDDILITPFIDILEDFLKII